MLRKIPWWSKDELAKVKLYFAFRDNIWRVFAIIRRKQMQFHCIPQNHDDMQFSYTRALIPRNFYRCTLSVRAVPLTPHLMAGNFRQLANDEDRSQ